MDVLSALTLEDVQSIFPKKAAATVKANWPEVAAAMRTAGWAGDEVMVAYALATVRTETGDFSPAIEGASKPARGADGRDFGAYDQVALQKNGQLRVRFDAGGHIRLTTSGLGNRPYLAGSPLDPDVSGENRWRDLKGLPRRALHATDDGRRFRGRGYVQLTGRANYAAADKDLQLGLLDKPERACERAAAAQLLIWYLKPRQKRIRAHLGGEVQNYLEARAVVNGKTKEGGVHGLEAFTTAYDKLKALIAKRKAGLPAPPASAVPVRKP